MIPDWIHWSEMVPCVTVSSLRPQTLTLFLPLTAYQIHQHLQLVLSSGCTQNLTASVPCHSYCLGLTCLDLLPRWLQWSSLWPSCLSLSPLWPISTKTSLSQLKSKLDGTTLWIEPLMAFITLRTKLKSRSHLLKPSDSVLANFWSHSCPPKHMRSRCNLQASGLLLPEGLMPLPKKPANWPPCSWQKCVMRKVSRSLFTCCILSKVFPGCSFQWCDSQ